MSSFKLIILIGFIGLIVSCTRNKEIENEVGAISKIDTAQAIEKSVEYIFKTTRFANDYYNSPLKIVKSKNVPPNTVFYLNGLKTELVSKKPDRKILIDWKNPQPYLEVLELKKTNKNRVFLVLLFRTTGNEFSVWLKRGKSKCLEIDSLSHSQI